MPYTHETRIIDLTVAELLEIIHQSQPEEDNRIVTLSKGMELTGFGVWKFKNKFKPVNKGGGSAESEYLLKDIKPYVKLKIA